MPEFYCKPWHLVTLQPFDLQRPTVPLWNLSIRSLTTFIYNWFCQTVCLHTKASKHPCKKAFLYSCVQPDYKVRTIVQGPTTTLPLKNFSTFDNFLEQVGACMNLVKLAPPLRCEIAEKHTFRKGLWLLLDIFKLNPFFWLVKYRACCQKLLKMSYLMLLHCQQRWR